MYEHLALSATAFLMGFLPVFEIYLAIPVTMALGLDGFSAVLWSCIGNFLAIPFVIVFYDALNSREWWSRYLMKLTSSKWSVRMKQHGCLFILIATPLIGSWAVGVLGKVIGMEKPGLLVSSGGSIIAYGILIGVLTQFGIDIL
ncbi:MAG: hypothetical protein D5R99_04065 [Methanocalculus sp. MSAO_Arc1]|uniref:small multi-drug export protein n=1 Tax=Methanocalculus TaxID=71151 RepID=UPI000FF83178|nr:MULTISPECIES: small multi-drug export protein [unclassified Methanocalculus]MCP1662514.1 putative membrane protein [Methanocalculus sp. AMF5]RQD80851.1 MAG: hypothetical protein D5R99_04065 [Methanocalculus sp. MSAO_Arc1]